MNLTFTESAWMMSSFAIAYALAVIPAGLLSDKFGGERILLIATVSICIFCYIFLTSKNFQIAVLSRILMGISGGLVLPASVKTLSYMFHPSGLSKATGILGSGWGAGLTLAFIVIPSIIAETWRTGILFTVIFTLVIALATSSYLSLKRSFLKVNSQIQYKPKEFFKKRVFYAILINFTFIGVLTNVTTWAPLFLINQMGAHLFTMGFIIAAIGLAGIVSSFSGGFTAKIIGRERVIMISALMCMFLPLILTFSYNFFSAFLLIFMIGWSTYYGFGPLIASLSLSVRKENLGLTFGFFNSLSNMAAFAYPLITGAILDIFGKLELSFYTTALLAIIGVIGSLLISKNKI